MFTASLSQQLFLLFASFGSVTFAHSTLVLVEHHKFDDFLIPSAILERRQDASPAPTVTITDVVGEGAPVLVTAFDNPFSIVATETEYATVTQTEDVTFIVPIDSTAAASIMPPQTTSPSEIGAVAATTAQPAIGSEVPISPNSLAMALLVSMGISVPGMGSGSQSAAPTTSSSFPSSPSSAPTFVPALTQALPAAETSFATGPGNDTAPAAPTIAVPISSQSSAPVFVSILTQAFSF